MHLSSNIFFFFFLNILFHIIAHWLFVHCITYDPNKKDKRYSTTVRLYLLVTLLHSISILFYIIHIDIHHFYTYLMQSGTFHTLFAF